MKPYGHSRRAKLECIYGCCTGKAGKKKNCRALVDKARRKTARQAGKMFSKLLADSDIDAIINT